MKPRTRPRRTISSDMAEEAFPAFDRPLRRPQIGPVEDEVQRLLVRLVERFGKSRHEPSARRVAAELREIDDTSERLASDYTAERGARLGGDRHVGMLPAEHHDRIAGSAAVGTRAQSTDGRHRPGIYSRFIHWSIARKPARDLQTTSSKRGGPRPPPRRDQFPALIEMRLSSPDRRPQANPREDAAGTRATRRRGDRRPRAAGAPSEALHIRCGNIPSASPLRDLLHRSSLPSHRHKRYDTSSRFPSCWTRRRAPARIPQFKLPDRCHKALGLTELINHASWSVKQRGSDRERDEYALRRHRDI
jgi:hypothetical protein